MPIDAPFPSLGEDPWGAKIQAWRQDVENEVNTLPSQISDPSTPVGSAVAESVGAEVADQIAAEDIPAQVTAAVAAAPTVVDAAAAAVDTEIAGRDLIEGGSQDEVGIALAIVDEDGNRSWLEVATSGGPTEYSLGFLSDEFLPTDTFPDGFHVEPIAEGTGVALAIVDERGYRTWLESGYDGAPTDYSIEFIREKLGVEPPTETGWAAYGDSTTQGTDVDGLPPNSGWVELLGADLGVAIANRGGAGARAEEITARLGGIVPTGNVSGGSIPASGPVALVDLDVNPVRAGSASSYVADLRTQTGVVVRGTVSRSGSGVNFTRTVNGSSIPVTGGLVELHSVTGAGDWGKVIFLGQGINNEGLITSGTQTVDDVKAWYADATSRITSGRIIVWGVLDRGPSEGPGTPVGEFIAELETWLAQKYGADFAPFRRYLTTPQALADALIFEPSYVPTQADLDAQAVGTVPPSFRTSAGSVHMAALGHKLQARYMQRHVTAPQREWA